MTNEQIAQQLRTLAKQVEKASPKIKVDERRVVVTAATILEKHVHNIKITPAELKFVCEVLRGAAGTWADPYEIENED